LNRRYIFAVLGLIFALSGCTTSDSVSEFCASATATLDAAGPVFADMKQSCLREVASRAEFGAFTPPAQDDANCIAIGDKAAGAQAALTILSDFYVALNDLASFGSTKAGADAQGSASQAEAAVGSGSSTASALGSLAKMIASASSGRYQQKQIEKDLASASGNITQVDDALIKILQEDYIGRQLGSEEEKLGVRYKEFAKLHPSPEVTLTLDHRWHSDERTLQARRASAKSLIAALNTLSKGTADLAANAPHLNAKESAALLEPYVVQLKSLLPLIQRGF
jgi:hypothetical protein